MAILSEDNLKVYLACCEVPKEAQKPIQAGRLKGMTDINAMWRIKKVSELFGVCGIGWIPTVESETIEEFEGAKEKLVKVVMSIKYKYENKNGEEAWSEPLPGVGTAKIVAMEKNGAYLDDNAFKKARTDAFGGCCKWLGIGGSVYWQNDPGESKYDKENVPTYATKKDIEELVKDATAMGFGEKMICAFFKVPSLENTVVTMDQIASCRLAMKQAKESKK